MISGIINYISTSLYYKFASAQRVKNDLKTAVLNGQTEIVTEILSNAGNAISQTDINEIILEAYSFLDKSGIKPNCIQAIIILLENASVLTVLSEIFAKEHTTEGKKLLDCLMSSLSANLYRRLSVDTSLKVVGNIVNYLIDNKNIPALIARILNFDNYLLMQCAINSENVEIVRTLIELGVDHKIRRNGKTHLDIAKEGCQSDLVKVLLTAMDGEIKLSERDWLKLLEQENDNFREVLRKSYDCVSETFKAAQADLLPSGLLLTQQQIDQVEAELLSSQKSIYPQNDSLPFTVIKNEDKELIAFYNGGELGGCLGEGRTSWVSFGQNLNTKQFCAIKKIPGDMLVPIHTEIVALKKMGRFFGNQTIIDDSGISYTYIFSTLAFGISYSEMPSHLNIRNQCAIVINLLKAYLQLGHFGIEHGDVLGRNLVVNVDDLSVTIIDFGGSPTYDFPIVSTEDLGQCLRILFPFINEPQLRSIMVELYNSSFNKDTIEESFKKIKEIIARSVELPASCLMAPEPILPSRQSKVKKQMRKTFETQDFDLDVILKDPKLMRV